MIRKTEVSFEKQRLFFLFNLKRKTKLKYPIKIVEIVKENS